MYTFDEQACWKILKIETNFDEFVLKQSLVYWITYIFFGSPPSVDMTTQHFINVCVSVCAHKYK